MGVILMSVCSARTRTSQSASAAVSEKVDIMLDIKDVLKEMTSVLVSINEKMSGEEFEAQSYKAKESEVEVDENMTFELNGRTRNSFPAKLSQAFSVPEHYRYSADGSSIIVGTLAFHAVLGTLYILYGRSGPSHLTLA